MRLHTAKIFVLHHAIVNTKQVTKGAIHSEVSIFSSSATHLPTILRPWHSQ